MKKYIHLIVAIFTILLYSCGQDPIKNEYELPKPEIVISNPVPCIGEEITIYYQTETSASPSWKLNGEELSTDAILKKTFTKEGKHEITLTLTDGKGGKVTVAQYVEVLGKKLTDALTELVKTPSVIWICAHRSNTYEGLVSGDIPENSIEAISEAIKKGCEVIEIDIRTTYDGHFVLMHDETINRTTNGAGYVKNKTLAELRSLKLKSTKGNVTDCTIPTLEEALLAGRGKVFYNLDIAGKPLNVGKMVRLVDSLHMVDRVIYYTGGDREMIQSILSVDKDAIIFPWVSNTADINYYSSNKRIKLIHIDYTSTNAPNIISFAREKQMISFSNVLGDADKAILKNDFTEIEKLKTMQLQLIQTDYTELIKNYLNK